MQSIQNITLEWAILHTADGGGDAPMLADEPISLDGDMRAYFEEHIRSCLRSSQLRMGKFFASNGAVTSGCGRMIGEGPDSFLDVSHALAWWLQKQIERADGPAADLAICPFIDTDTKARYIALLKLDPMRVYLRRKNGGVVFPPAAQIVHFAGPGVLHKGIERANDIKAVYLIADLLALVANDGIGFVAHSNLYQIREESMQRHS